MKRTIAVLLGAAFLSLSASGVFAQELSLELSPSLMKVSGITAPIGIVDPNGDGWPSGESYSFDSDYALSGELKVTRGDLNFTAFMHSDKTEVNKTNNTGDEIWSLWINPLNNKDNKALTVNAETEIKVSLFDLDYESDLTDTSAWNIRLVTGLRFASVKQETEIHSFDNPGNYDLIEETSKASAFGPKIGLAMTSRHFDKVKVYANAEVALMAGYADATVKWTQMTPVTSYEFSTEKTFAVATMPSFEVGAKYPVGDSLSFGLGYKAAVWNRAITHVQALDDTTANYSDKQYDLVMHGLKLTAAYRF